jgi:hypothetical protein
MIVSVYFSTITILVQLLISNGKRNLKWLLLVRFDIVIVVCTGEKISSLFSEQDGRLIDLLGEWDKSIVLHTIFDNDLPSHRISDTSDKI